MKKEEPFACLMPSSLVHEIPNDVETVQALKHTTKITLLVVPEMTWIVHNIPRTQHQVLMGWDINTFADNRYLCGIMQPPPTFKHEEWVRQESKARSVTKH